jgi:hypothetical protein
MDVTDWLDLSFWDVVREKIDNDGYKEKALECNFLKVPKAVFLVSIN